MTFNDIVLLFQENGGIIAVCAVVIMSLVEVSPIKINPWSWIGNIFNKGVITKMEKIEQELNNEPKQPKGKELPAFMRKLFKK